MAYIFTLKYQLSDHDSDPDVLVERLGAAGCDDVLVGVGQPGRPGLDCSCEAGSTEEAVALLRPALKRYDFRIQDTNAIEGSVNTNWVTPGVTKNSPIEARG